MRKVLFSILAILLLAGQAKAFGWQGGSASSKVVRVLAESGTPSAVTGTLSETTLATITLPAGAMGLNGGVRITPLFSFTNSANNKSVKVKFVGTAYYSGTYTTTNVNQACVIIRNRNSVSSQVGFASSGGTASGFGISATVPVTSSVDTSVSQTITITGTLANTGETITLEGYTVELLPGAN